MRWIVGIDFNERSGGALQMAAWLRERATPDVPQEFVAVHVLPERIRKMMAREATLDAPELTCVEMRRVVTLSGIAEPFSGYTADWADTPEEGLTLAAANPNVTGIVIGRVSGREPRALARLGRVARRLLRRLPAPVMVVPPDLPASDIGRGPVMLATDLDDASLPAAAMARDLANALGRELVVASVDETLYQLSAFAPEAIVPLTSLRSRSADDVQAWARAHGLESAHVVTRDGERVTALSSLAVEHDSPLVVCGSRRLALGERIFASSTASGLARRGDRAVLVVPSRPGTVSS
jgi:nucleotide-binding universal stress UspA family protein